MLLHALFSEHHAIKTAHLFCNNSAGSLLCTCYNAITGSAPSYLSELLHRYSPFRSLRSSSNTRILKLQHLNRKTHRFCTFSHFGPHIWNNYRKTSGNLLLPLSSKVNSKHFSSQNISVKHLFSTLLSVCTMCV